METIRACLYPPLPRSTLSVYGRDFSAREMQLAPNFLFLCEVPVDRLGASNCKFLIVLTCEELQGKEVSFQYFSLTTVWM